MMTKHGPVPERRFWGQVFLAVNRSILDKIQNARRGVRRRTQGTALMN